MPIVERCETCGRRGLLCIGWEIVDRRSTRDDRRAHGYGDTATKSRTEEILKRIDLRAMTLDARIVLMFLVVHGSRYRRHDRRQVSSPGVLICRTCLRKMPGGSYLIRRRDAT